MPPVFNKPERKSGLNIFKTEIDDMLEIWSAREYKVALFKLLHRFN